MADEVLPFNLQNAITVYGPLGVWAATATLFSWHLLKKYIHSLELRLEDRKKDGEKVIAALNYSSDAHREGAEASKEVSQVLNRQQASIEALRLRLEMTEDLPRKRRP